MMASRIAIPDTAFRLSHGKKRPRVEDMDYLAWIRTLPCLITGRRDFIEAAHVRYGDLAFGKTPTGMQEKPDDIWTLPLQREIHAAQHKAGDERAWWAEQRMDPLQTCLALHRVSGDDAAAEAILSEARRRRLPAKETT